MRNILAPKVYHMADKINQKGGVSALCFKRPMAINLKVANWTTQAEAVTCLKCKALLAAPSTTGEKR